MVGRKCRGGDTPGDRQVVERSLLLLPESLRCLLRLSAAFFRCKLLCALSEQNHMEALRCWQRVRMLFFMPTVDSE